MSILLHSLSYGTIESGSMAGFLAYVMELGGGKSPSVSPVDILEKIDSSNFKTNYVRIRGVKSTIDQGESSGDLLALVKALANRGFLVSIEHPANYYPPWASDIHHKVAVVHGPRILGTECHELWYYLESLDQIYPVF